MKKEKLGKRENNIYGTLLQPAGTQFLKAIAIVSVLVIHVLSSIQPSPFVTNSPFQIIAVSLDQLARISVPLFVAISGYGLATHYADKALHFRKFLTKRVLKILPFYLLWSCIFATLFYFIPIWAPTSEQPNFAWQLLLGRADYHLYFVPMIFQLYICFPILFYFFKKLPTATLLVAIFIQLLWWWFFSYQGFTVTSWKYFAGDGEQYLWMTNWIAYFILGMYLPNLWKLLQKNNLVFFIVFLLLICSSIYIIFDALNAIQNGVDPLFALKFTRYPLFLYSSLAIIVVSFVVAKMKKIPKIAQAVGEVSYLIYLSHTLFLRIIFSIL